jgi:hypothetical protein
MKSARQALPKECPAFQKLSADPSQKLANWPRHKAAELPQADYDDGPGPKRTSHFSFLIRPLVEGDKTGSELMCLHGAAPSPLG